ncbi:MAG: transposase [Candidatus Omnitrophica bacterium]|nr:transposase [Candidatus Omnitrophota bacterium]
MTRPPRQLLDGGCDHLIARGNNRQFLLTEEGAFRYFLDLLARAKSRYPARRYHYCLMSNHLHLLLEIARGDHLPRFMQGLLQGYGRWYKSRTGYVGHVWQGRYKSPLVDEDPYYRALGPTNEQRQAAYRDFVRLETPYASVLDTHLLEAAF